MATTSEIKKALVGAGFEVYRVEGARVHVAERVRDNLIMDAGIRVDADSLTVRFYVRAQQADFPRSAPDDLYARARALAAQALASGWTETRSFETTVPDPGDPGRTLDRWFQVQIDKRVATLPEALEAVRFAMSTRKLATHG
jgi:hypothetical protein